MVAPRPRGPRRRDGPRRAQRREDRAGRDASSIPDTSGRRRRATRCMVPPPSWPPYIRAAGSRGTASCDTLWIGPIEGPTVRV